MYSNNASEHPGIAGCWQARDFLYDSHRGRDRLSIFIDGSNFYHSLKAVCGRTDLDYRSFVRLLEVGQHSRQRLITAVHFYTAVAFSGVRPQVYSSQQRFLHYLRGITNPPFLVQRVELAVLKSTTRKSGYHLLREVDWTHYVEPELLRWHRAG
ncbi:MAG: hypothetical protein KKF41_07725 [Actinobacteria bacterium]|nr:hypothetical protein [Actinomycetota bacterium]MBU1944139.1 hypothetical protein [Actinomycetota bacterium]MBU2687458.1 hypothetical protein [Actinomycetota bacterium]